MEIKAPSYLPYLASGLMVFGLAVSPAAFADQNASAHPADASNLYLAQAEAARAEERAEAAEDDAEAAEERAEDQAEAAEEAREDDAELAEERADDEAEAAEQRAEAVDDADGQEGMRSSGGSDLDEESAGNSATENTTEDWRGYGR